VILVLIDESHNLRHTATAAIQGGGDIFKHRPPLLFPHGHAAQQERLDVYWQIKLFHQDDKTDCRSIPRT